MRTEPHTLPCGCCTDGTPCADHSRPDDAPDWAAAVALALFLGMVAVWAAILAP